MATNKWRPVIVHKIARTQLLIKKRHLYGLRKYFELKSVFKPVIFQQLQKANTLVGGNSLLFAIVNLPTYRLKRQIIFSFTDLLGK